MYRYTNEANKLKDEVVLDFNPNKSSDKNLQKIFQDELAQTLWLGIKQGHLVNQNFEKNCLIVAKGLKKYEDYSKIILSSYLRGYGMIGVNEDEFIDELYPFVKGERKLRYKIDGA